MQSAMINTLVVGTARTDAPVTAIAKAPDDRRFFDALKAGAAVEAPAATTPVKPAAASVGKVPVAMMRPPDVSSPEAGVAKTAAKAQEQGKSQDTGAVSVAKPDAVNEEGQSEETATQDQVSSGAAEANVALQQSAQPLLATTVLTPEYGKDQAATSVASAPTSAQTAKTEVAVTTSEYENDDAVASRDISPAPARTPASVATAPVVNAPQARQDSEPQVAPIVAATVSTPKNGTDQVPTNVVNTSPTVQAADTAVAVTDSKYKSDDAVVSSGTVPVPAPAKAIVATAPVASIPIASTSVASTSVVSTPVVSTAVPIAPQARQDSEPQVVANDKVVSAPQAPPQNTEPQAEPMMSATVSTPGNGKAQAATSLASTSSTVQTAKAEVTATKSESNTDDEVTPVDTAPVPAPAPAVVASAPVANAPVVSQPQARQDAVPQVEPSLATAVVTPVNGKAQAVTLVANTASTAAAAKAEVTGTRSERKSDDAVASVDTAPVPTQAPALVASAPIVSAPQPQPDVEPQVESIVATDISTPVIGKAQAPKSVASTAAASGTAKTEVAGKKSDRKSDDAVASSDTTPVPAQAAATVAAVPVVSLTQVSQNTVPQAEATAANDVKIGSATAKTVPPVVKKSDSKPAAAATADAPVAAASVAPVLHDANVPTAAVTGVAQVTGNVAATTGHVAHGPVAANGTSTAKVSESEIQSSSSSSASLSSAASTPANSDLRTLVSTPNVLEIGFASGSHGWLKVRAELDGSGEVAASVVAATASAAEGLHKELPGLSQYLAGEHVAVSSLVVNATAKGADAQDVSTGAGSTGTQAGGRQGEGQSGSGNQAQTNSGVDAGVLSTGVWTDFESGFPGVQFPAPMLADANGSGSWLSVRV